MIRSRAIMSCTARLIYFRLLAAVHTRSPILTRCHIVAPQLHRPVLLVYLRKERWHVRDASQRSKPDSCKIASNAPATPISLIRFHERLPCGRWSGISANPSLAASSITPFPANLQKSSYRFPPIQPEPGAAQSSRATKKSGIDYV